MVSKYLDAHGTIGIAALCSPIDKESYDKSCAELVRRGYTLSIPLDPTQAYGTKEFAFACASAKDRAAALEQLYRDDSVDVILAVRGGYGSLELLEVFDFDAAIRNPKPLIGFSDVTALLGVLAFHHSLPAIHGPSLRSFARVAEEAAVSQSADALLQLLQGSFVPRYEGAVLREGEAQGKVLVGNLTLLRSLLGTAWDFSYDDCILVLEEVNDAPFRIMRSLMQLKLAGKLDNLAALAFGDLGDFVGNGLSTAEVLQHFIATQMADTNYPILWKLPLGHGDLNLPLPLGVEGKIQGNIFSVVIK